MTKYSNSELREKIKEIQFEDNCHGCIICLEYHTEIVKRLLSLFSDTLLEVIEKDDFIEVPDRPINHLTNLVCRARNKLRADQRAKLNKIIGGK